MKRFYPTLILLGAAGAFAQQSEPIPIYRVTVTERTVKAINYQYRSGPTLIDFRGTVLLPKSKGTATVESKQGRSEVDVHFENLTEPSQFGREYLTYVLWALTPEGRPLNLGEAIAGGSNKAHLHVTTDVQAFAMIVTAEPYAAVRQPSDVVVLENVVRPETIGKIVEVQARYELLPRGHYSWKIPDQLSSAASNAPKVSMRKYEELLQVYQAQNALGTASAAGAAEYAPNTYAKAQQLMTTAQQLQSSKADSHRVIETAREAAQTAEDARLIAERRTQMDKISKAQADAAAAKQGQIEAQQEADRLRVETERLKAEAQEAQARADQDRIAREREQAAPPPVAQPTSRNIPPPPPPATRPQQEDAAHSALRMRLLEQLNNPLATRDTPRGLIATVPGSAFAGADLKSESRDQVARIAAILAANPGLRVEVEGHSNTEANAPASWKRAQAVREILVGRGMSPNAVTSRGLGSTRPITSDATEGGREANEAVEIVISGAAIGNLPFWDRTYPLRPGAVKTSGQ